MARFADCKGVNSKRLRVVVVVASGCGVSGVCMLL